MLPTRIYLTGFMGSGKSTAGPLIADALGYAFIDLDEVIVRMAGRSIPDIFAEEGESGFRRRETEALRLAAERENAVVALGGGALTFEHNLEAAKQSGVVVYLRVPADELVSRLMQGETERPLLHAGSEVITTEAVRNKVNELIARREPFYARAQITVEAGRQSVEETVEAVLEAIGADNC